MNDFLENPDRALQALPRFEAKASLDVSVVVPVFNEEDSLPHLVNELHAVLGRTGRSYELIFVDDGSTDGSFAWLDQKSASDPALTVLRFRRNFGQTAALQAGLDAARGLKIVTMDADLQNDAADIPGMLDRLDGGHDLIAGWRVHRQDPFLSRRLPSMIANRIISMATRVKLHDYGCTLKAMTREVAKELRLYGEMHRFIPAVASFMGVSILEVQVNHRARQYGRTKYGIGRTLRVVLDLMTVRFMQSYLTRPMQVFGLAGLVCFGLGSLLCLELAFEKIFQGQPLAQRPLLLLGVLLIVVGIQLVSLGLVADIVSRTYHESQGKRPYHVRSLRVGRGTRGVARPAEVPTPAVGGADPTSSSMEAIALALGSKAPDVAPAVVPGTITAPPGASFPEPKAAVETPKTEPTSVEAPVESTARDEEEPAPVSGPEVKAVPPPAAVPRLPALTPPAHGPPRPSAPRSSPAPILAEPNDAALAASLPSAPRSAPPPPSRRSATGTLGDAPSAPAAAAGGRSAPPPPPRRGH